MATKTKRRPKLVPFVSTHKLDFEVSDYPWQFTPGIEWKMFRIGTCDGLWGSTTTSYQILSVVNNRPGNGHFSDVLEWFENSCRRDGKCLRIREVLNQRFKQHLLTKRGFVLVGDVDVIKTFKAR